MPIPEVVVSGALYGAILSALLTVVIVGSLRLNAEMWVGDYPPDIRERFGPMSPKARRQRIMTATLFLAVLVGVLWAGLASLAKAAGPGGPGPLAVFAFVLVAASVFNLYDLLVIDWLLMVRLQPRYIVLTGTEGMAGYQDYGFHFRAFLVGVAGSLVVAALVAAGFWFFG